VCQVSARVVLDTLRGRRTERGSTSGELLDKGLLVSVVRMGGIGKWLDGVGA